ncbi:Acetyltransferase (GNAT) domain-containing protein [Pelagirhabdus alkalitolerans]|uniref:Acetyltransferase (GNAT) domain-containing protein n=1 Tax=Pelagirhabdus alkalitolerans TaxID=1612202 RepID=A0A1G6GNS8_9BACI|nr:GNAT family N-acetyltransferase [Pelagirhabdus alkalitolerans]SDB83405.1 Acetyltransferase (GNAT) domain-containing protein [Pelagirhabdus alkalitolerans]
MSTRFYEIKHDDLEDVKEVLANAFMNDPLKHAFENEANFLKQYQAFFLVPVTYALKYGYVYSPSDDLEGVIVYTRGRYASMTPWRMLMSGAMKYGLQVGREPLKRLDPFMKLSKKDRKSFTSSYKDYFYVMLFGIHSDHQGKGHGKALLQHIIKQADQELLPIYLETETEKNVSIYEHFGFKVVNQHNIPSLNMTFYAMLRESKPR